MYFPYWLLIILAEPILTIGSIECITWPDNWTTLTSWRHGQPHCSVRAHHPNHMSWHRDFNTMYIEDFFFAKLLLWHLLLKVTFPSAKMIPSSYSLHWFWFCKTSAGPASPLESNSLYRLTILLWLAKSDLLFNFSIRFFGSGECPATYSLAGVT